MRRFIKKLMVITMSPFLAKRQGPLTERDRKLIDDIRKAFADVVIPSKLGLPPSESEWITNMEMLQHEFLSRDPRSFLQWEVILETMFVLVGAYTGKELAQLRADSEWSSKWRKAIQEDPQGSPICYPFAPFTSSNRIHYGYHMMQAEQVLNIRISEIGYVLEFGGGYGGMAKVLHNLGFKGRYVIYDLPMFSLLQNYYLASLGVPMLTTYDQDGFTSIAGSANLTAEVNARQNKKGSLFLATWSFSETPTAFRNQILPLINQFDHFLIGYAHEFRENDNISFFGDWTKSMPHIEWRNWDIPHMPGHSYLMGKVK